MKLKLAKKAQQSDKEPLVVMYIHEGKKVIQKVAIGGTIEVPDEVGYDVLSKYKGMLQMAGNDAPEAPAEEEEPAKAEKSLAGYRNKSGVAKNEKAES